jgi:DNA-binding beta-propeller fold protein YncE
MTCITATRTELGNLCALAALGCLALGANPHRGPPARNVPPLEQREDIPLPGPATRFDYQSLDPTTNRLYISHMNAGELIVFDLGDHRVLGVVRNLPRVTGICAVPALGKVYASVPGAHQVVVIDARTLRVEARVGSIGFPDGIAYAPGSKKVYVSDESGGGELVIDGLSNRAVTTIPLGGEAGNTIFDPESRRILVAVQTRGEVVEIDPRTDRLVGRHHLSGAVHPHGMTSDPLHRLLFVADEERASLLTVDMRSMTVVDRHRVGEEPDVLAFDPGLLRLYVASESGPVSVFAEEGDRLLSQGSVTLPHAHTVSVDPRTHLVYLPLQSIHGRPVLRIMAVRKPSTLGAP